MKNDYQKKLLQSILIAASIACVFELGMLWDFMIHLTSK